MDWQRLKRILFYLDRAPKSVMKLVFIPPRTELKPYVSKIWLFESELGLPPGEKSLIAPNARPKIIIPYKNTLTTTDRGRTDTCRENDVVFIGIRDVPVTLGTPQGATGSIGIELTTAGAYKFSGVSMHELTNKLFSFSDLYGKLGAALLERISENENTNEKISSLQDFLVERLRGHRRSNALVEYAVGLITASDGLMEIKELQRKTGYSKRYLNLLFNAHLGISPKTYATIIRFQRFYKDWISNGGAALQNLYDLYYDQSHFIKEFKRYTGYTPLQYTRLQNEFGKHF